MWYYCDTTILHKTSEGDYMMDERIDIISEDAESPFDPAYPVEFLSQSLDMKMAAAERSAERIYNAVIKAAPAAAQVHEATKKGFRLVVDATESTLDAIESGRIKLTTEKSGKLFAQIREASGRYGSKLPIKKEVYAKGLDPVQVASALQMKALQEQLQQVSEQIAMIDQSVREVIQGQQNDRIGLYYSGLTLFLESRNINDPELRKALIAQSMRALSEATYQLTLTIQSDIRFLATGEYRMAKGKSVKQIDARMQSINQSFQYIHQASMLRAGIYCSEGELAAMTTVLSEYSRFIEGTVAKNANLLAQCDVSDSGTESGVWQSRKNLRLDVADIVKKLNTPGKVIYLGTAEEDETWEESKDA